jgi:hypothetical protein
MDDDIARVNQHPIAKGHPFYPCVAHVALLELAKEAVRDGPNVALGPARSDNHRVANGRFPCQVDADDVVSLGVLEGVDDEMGEGGGSRSGAFCAVRSEFGELLFLRVKPQLEDPSVDFVPASSGRYTSTCKMCMIFATFSRRRFRFVQPGRQKGQTGGAQPGREPPKDALIVLLRIAKAR